MVIVQVWAVVPIPANMLPAPLLPLTGLLVSAIAGVSANPFLPAEPGHTPKCAKKGTSFCEYVDNYPE